MQQINTISRNDLSELDVHSRVAFVYCVHRLFEKKLNEYTIENDSLLETKNVLESLMKDLATGKIQPTLRLANKIWRIVFDLSVGVDIAKKKGEIEEYNYYLTMHECAKFLYNTVLAIQSQTLPNSIYMARALDANEALLQSIDLNDTNQKLNFNEKIEQIYQTIQNISENRKNSSEKSIPIDVLDFEI